MTMNAHHHLHPEGVLGPNPKHPQGGVSKGTIHHSLLATRYSLLATRYSLLATRYSQHCW